MGRTARVGLAVIFGSLLLTLMVMVWVLVKAHGVDWHDVMSRMGIDFLFVEKNGARCWTSRFKLMNGQLKKEIKVGQEQVAELFPLVSLEAGELEIVIVDPKGEEFYRKTWRKDGPATERLTPINLPGPGRWKIYVIGRGAQGEFRFSWNYIYKNKVQ